MIAEIWKNAEKIEAKKQELQNEYKERLPNRSNEVRYVMPALEEPFPKLSEAIYDSKHREDFYRIYYWLETNDGHIKKLVPASEYYKLAFRAIADKQYSMRLSIKRVEALKNEIQGDHAATREVMPRTGQPSFDLNEQVYQLKSELGNILFTTRSIMDSVSTLLHFLYGPSSYQFSSFADFKKYIVKDEQGGHLKDEEMKKYINDNMGWFSLLRDIRDYITHYSSIDVSFYEEEGSLRIYLQDRFELNSLLDSLQDGLTNFFTFFDDHFSKKIETETPVVEDV